MSERGFLLVEIYGYYCLWCEIGIGLEFLLKKELVYGKRIDGWIESRSRVIV